MAVFRIHKNKNYTAMSNYHLRDKNLSYKAKGLLSMMLSLPDDWDYSIKGLEKISKEKEVAIKDTLNELKRYNYLIVNKDRNEKGLFNYEYNIYEKPGVCYPGMDNPEVDNPGLDNQVQINTNILNTKKQNTKEDKEIYKESIEEIINYLNNKIDTHYRTTTPKTKQLITARLNEGFKVDDFKTVIDNKYSTWFKDKKMCNYLRPETLFGTKFENYLNEKVKKRLTDEELINMLKEMDKNETK